MTTVTSINGLRGLSATRDFAPGDAILCDPALAAVPLDSTSSGAKSAWHVAAILALQVLKSGIAGALTDLEPKSRLGFIIPDDEKDDYSDALEGLKTTAADALTVVDADEVERMLHVVVRNALQLCGCQALCVRAAMINHSDRPNATHLGFARTADKQLFACIRAVEPIKAGSMVTISYLADLATSSEDRRAGLAHHGIEPEDRPCDAALEGWQAAGVTARAQLEGPIGACNVAADSAWQAAESLQNGGGGGGGGDAAAAAKQRLMEAATHYAKLLQLATGKLDDGHALLLIARARLAKVMMQSGAQRSQANALPLWRAVLQATRPCVPANWPALLEPLRGVAAAAEAAGDAELAVRHKEEAARVLAVLNPSCSDVRETGRVPDPEETGTTT